MAGVKEGVKERVKEREKEKAAGSVVAAYDYALEEEGRVKEEEGEEAQWGKRGGYPL